MYKKEQRETHKHSDNGGAHGPPSRIRLKSRRIGKLAPIKVLCTHATVESEVGDTNPEPCGQPTSGGHAREPRKNHPGAIAYSHVGQK